MEDVILARLTTGTAHDYIINMCLNRESFQAIRHIIKFQGQNMMVVVESRRRFCWSCKQLGHFSRSCPQKTKMSTITAAITTATTAGTRAWTPPQQRRGVDPGKLKGEEKDLPFKTNSNNNNNAYNKRENNKWDNNNANKG